MINISKEKLNGDKIEDLINFFIKQIYELDESKKTLDEKISNIDNLINHLIDYCIKKKIFYYVENKISYNNIVCNFKYHLIKFIKNLVDPFDNIISKYIINDTNLTNWDNISDINSLMFKNFKNLNESFEKNVSFKDSIQINNYDDGYDGFEFNIKPNSINNNLINFVENNEEIIENNDKDNIKNLSLFIKILVNQNKYLVEFIDKLIFMCKILSDIDIKYKKVNPYD